MWISKKIISLFFCCWLIILSSWIPLFSRQNEAQLASSKPKQTKPVPDKRTWEKIISFPGTVIVFPFKLVFKSTEKAIVFLDETKIIYRIEDYLKSDDELRALIPTYAARSGAGIKLYQKGLFNPASKLELMLAAGEHWRQHYQIRFKRLHLFGGQTQLLAGYQILLEEPFYGIGPNAEIENESNYALEKSTFEIAQHFQLTSDLTMNLTTGIELNQIHAGKDSDHPSTPDIYSPETLYGLSGQKKMAYYQTGLQLDTKNRAGNPTGGWDAEIEAGLFHGNSHSQSGFWKASTDITRYLHLFYNRTLVLRIAGETNRPVGDRQIPFYLLSELGRRETIRGFERGRYRDRDMFLGTAEYRYPILQNKESGIEALIFVDAGQVSPDISRNFSFNDFKVGFGGGFRLYNTEGSIMKFEIGKSADDFRVYFVLN